MCSIPRDPFPWPFSYVSLGRPKATQWPLHVLLGFQSAVQLSRLSNVISMLFDSKKQETSGRCCFSRRSSTFIAHQNSDSASIWASCSSFDSTRNGNCSESQLHYSYDRSSYSKAMSFPPALIWIQKWWHTGHVFVGVLILVMTYYTRTSNCQDSDRLRV